MWSQPVTDSAWQIINEWLIAETILSTPVDPMSLKRIAAIWSEEDDPSPGLKYTDHLADRHTVILNMLDHFVAKNEIKCCGR